MNLANTIACSIENEGIPEEEASKLGKRIVKMGTQFCVVGDGVDRNFGCYPSRRMAEDVMNGKSIIESSLPKNLLAEGHEYDEYETNVTHNAYKNVRWGVDDTTGEIHPPLMHDNVEGQRKKYRKIVQEHHRKHVVGGIVGQPRKAKKVKGGIPIQPIVNVKAGGPGSGRHKISDILEDRGWQRTKEAGDAAIYEHPDNNEKIVVDDRYQTFRHGDTEGSGAKELTSHLSSIMGASDECDWITVHGQHICIKEGQSKAQAIKEHFAKFKKVASKVKNSPGPKQYKKNFFVSKVSSKVSKSGKKEYHLFTKEGKKLGVFTDKSKMVALTKKLNGLDKLLDSKKQVSQPVKEKPISLDPKKIEPTAEKLARKLGISKSDVYSAEKWQDCADDSSNYMAAGCGGKVGEFYRQLGITPKQVMKFHDEMEDWISESKGSPLRDAAQEVLSGNPKSDLAKVLAAENAIVQANLGKGSVTLYRGISDEYARQAFKTALTTGGSSFKFKVNGVDSWSTDKNQASSFGSLILSAKVPTKYIMSSYKTNQALRESDEKEMLVAWPNKIAVINKKDLDIADGSDWAAGADEDSGIIDLTDDINWLHKNRGKKNKSSNSVIYPPTQEQETEEHEPERKNLSVTVQAGGPGSGRKHGKDYREMQEWMRQASLPIPHPPSNDEDTAFSLKSAFGPPMPKFDIKSPFKKSVGGKPKSAGSYGKKPKIEKAPSLKTDKNPGFKSLEAEEWGEPNAGAYQHAHMDTNLWFHPPSLRKPDHVPVDDPQEKDNKFLDVTKRNSKDTKDMRDKLLKRSAPGGTPPLVPVRTTLVSPQQAHDGMMASRQGRNRRRHGGGMFVSYDRRGCL